MILRNKQKVAHNQDPLVKSLTHSLTHALTHAPTHELFTTTYVASSLTAATTNKTPRGESVGCVGY